MDTRTDEILKEIQKVPVYQYAFLRPDEISLAEATRRYCTQNCSHYKTCWSCPPAVGKLEGCMELIANYEGGLFFTSIAGKQKFDKKAKEPLFSKHEALTVEVEDRLAKLGLQTYALTGGKCMLCRKCTYPKEPCRFPEYFHPCMEGFGISPADLTRRFGMDLYLDETHSIRFSLVLWKNLTTFIK